MATGDAEQLGSAGRALKSPISITGLSCLLESAQAISFSFIAMFALHVQIAELNRDERATLYKLPWIKASLWRLWSLGPLLEEVFVPEIAASPVLPRRVWVSLVRRSPWGRRRAEDAARSSAGKGSSHRFPRTE